MAVERASPVASMTSVAVKATAAQAMSSTAPTFAVRGATVLALLVVVDMIARVAPRRPSPYRDGHGNDSTT